MFDSIDFFLYNKYIELRINTTFTEEQMKDKEFRRKWTMYLLSIQYDVSGAEIPEEVLQEEADLIFG